MRELEKAKGFEFLKRREKGQRKRIFMCFHNSYIKQKCLELLESQKFYQSWVNMEKGNIQVNFKYSIRTSCIWRLFSKYESYIFLYTNKDPHYVASSSSNECSSCKDNKKRRKLFKRIGELIEFESITQYALLKTHLLKEGYTSEDIYEVFGSQKQKIDNLMDIFVFDLDKKESENHPSSCDEGVFSEESVEISKQEEEEQIKGKLL